MEEQKESKRQSIFRKKALDRVSSPEELDQYLTVTGPGVWLPLLAVVILLIGGIVWMIFGKIDVTIGVAVQATEKGVVCYIPDGQKNNVLKNNTVVIAGQSYAMTDVGLATELVTEEIDVNVRRAGMMEMGTTVDLLKVDADLMEGVYTGVITVETVNPIKYIIN